MSVELTAKEKQDLEKQHNRECERRVTNRIKAFLLHTEG